MSLPDKDVSIYAYFGKLLESIIFLGSVEDQEISRTVQHFKTKMSTDCIDINMNMIQE